MPDTNEIGTPEHRRALGRRDLEARACTCGDPDCNHMRLSVSCHPKTPAFVVYKRARGTIQLRCAICSGGSVEIAVADVGPSDA